MYIAKYTGLLPDDTLCNHSCIIRGIITRVYRRMFAEKSQYTRKQENGYYPGIAGIPNRAR